MATQYRRLSQSCDRPSTLYFFMRAGFCFFSPLGFLVGAWCVFPPSPPSSLCASPLFPHRGFLEFCVLFLKKRNVCKKSVSDSLRGRGPNMVINFMKKLALGAFFVRHKRGSTYHINTNSSSIDLLAKKPKETENKNTKEAENAVNRKQTSIFTFVCPLNKTRREKNTHPLPREENRQNHPEVTSRRLKYINSTKERFFLD